MAGINADSLRNEIDSWTLQSDINLLGYLNSVSKSFRVKSDSLTLKLQDLTGDVNIADVKLRNTFNDFLMLANTQFIENVIR